MTRRDGASPHHAPTRSDPSRTTPDPGGGGGARADILMKHGRAAATQGSGNPRAFMAAPWTVIVDRRAEDVHAVIETHDQANWKLNSGPVGGVSVEREDRRVGGRLYGRTAADLSGPLTQSRPTVEYHKVLSRRQQAAVQFMGWLHIAIVATLAIYLLLPGHLPRLSHGPLGDALTITGLVVLVALQLIVGLRTLTHRVPRCQSA